MRLSELQQHFQAYIFNPEKVEAIEHAILAPPTDNVLDRLSIYADGYTGHVTEAMGKIFPALVKYTGEEIFDEWCMEYVTIFPTTSFLISQVGNQFSQFLKEKKYFLESDIAALEWTIFTVLEAGNAAIFTPQMLANIPEEKWGEVIFVLHPSVVLLSFQYPVMKLYELLMKENKALSEIETSPEISRIWRKGLQVYYVRMEPLEALFLENLQQQKTFGEICEILSKSMPEEAVVNYALKQLLTWIQEEIVVEAKLL